MMPTNEAVFLLVSYVDRIIENWQETAAVIDPEYGYQNAENENAALEMKQEFRALLNAVIAGGDAE